MSFSEPLTKVYNCNCLDFMESDTFRNLVDSNRMVIVTDPPFNIGYHYRGYSDRLVQSDYLSSIGRTLTMYNLPFVLIHYPEMLYRISAFINMFPEKVISWVYNSNTAKQHRDIAFFGIKPDMNKVRQPYKNPNDKRIKARMEKGMGGGDYMTGGTSIRSKMCRRNPSTTPALCLLRLWIKLSDCFRRMYLSMIRSAGAAQQDLLASQTVDVLSAQILFPNTARLLKGDLQRQWHNRV